KGGVKADESIIDYAEFEAKKADVAANAILDACTGSNPRQPTQEEMEKLLECVYNDQDVDF
ncbi:butanol dehydrogenase, partial [Collinsella tanakaei]|nr:butanol dehydrogenase [Collinsella tanakaei]